MTARAMHALPQLRASLSSSSRLRARPCLPLPFSWLGVSCQPSIMTSQAMSTARQRGGRKRAGLAPRWRHQADGDGGAHPLLQQTLRKFYLRVHPDLFTHYPKQKDVNQESFSRFQAFLDDVRDKDTAPPRAGLHSYRFFLKTKEDGRFQEVALELRTTGGDCRNLVQRSLEAFFKECGLPEKFVWAEGDWDYSLEDAEERQTQQSQPSA